MKSWHEVYANNDEKCFFVGKDGKSGLVRGKDADGKFLTWRSVKALAKESGLTNAKVESIISKYLKAAPGMILQKNEYWGYHENVEVETEVEAGSKKTMVESDQANRVSAAAGGGYKKNNSAPVNIFGGGSGGSSPKPSDPSVAAPVVAGNSAP